MLHPEDLLCPEAMERTGRYSRRTSATVVMYRVSAELSAIPAISDVFSRVVRTIHRQLKQGIQRAILPVRQDLSGKQEHHNVKVRLSKEQSARTDEEEERTTVTGLPWTITIQEAAGILVPGAVLLQETPTSEVVQAAVPAAPHPEEAGNEGSINGCNHSLK